MDFRDHLQESLDNVDVLMVVVGPRWKGADRHGGTRIHSETDYVRTEVEIALKRDITVVPLLVGGSEMPEPSELPESIREFAYRNAVEIDSGRDFDHHIDGLIRAMDQLLHGHPSRPSKTIEPPAASRSIGPAPTKTPTHAPPETKSATRPGGLVPQIVGAVMLAQGLIHVGWFASSVIPALAPARQCRRSKMSGRWPIWPSASAGSWSGSAPSWARPGDVPAASPCAH